MPRAIVAAVTGCVLAVSCGPKEEQAVRVPEKPPAEKVSEPAKPSYNDTYFRAAFLEHDMPPEVPAGAAVEVHLVVANQGDGVWPAGGDTKVGYDWIDAGGEKLGSLAGRATLPIQVPPGGKVPLVVAVDTPARPGAYTLVVDMLVEKVAWFHGRGSRRLEVPVQVR
jgi:hypothetical protein